MPPVPPRPVRWAVCTLTVIAWIVVTAHALVPGVDDRYVTPEMARFAQLLAAAGSLRWLVGRMMTPAHELFRAGKMAGRLEALAELDDSVIRLDERREQRQLAVVRGGSTE